MKGNDTHSSTPRVSVVMAVYNSLRYLPEAVDSILNQTFSDFEFIIIDDGSNDGSGEWLEDRAKADARIRLVRQNNLGQTRSLNKGCSLARGEFIARMDADDVSYPERLERQLDVLLERREVAAVGSHVRYITERGAPLFIRRLPLSHEEIEQCHLARWGGFIMHPSVVIRRDAFEAVGGYDEGFRIAQDYDLWFRLARVGRLQNLDHVLLDYRHHASAMSAVTSREQAQEVDLIHAQELKARALASSVPLPQKYRVYPDDRIWLAGAASDDGFVRAAFANAAFAAFCHLRGLCYCVFWAGRSVVLHCWKVLGKQREKVPKS